MGRPRKLPLSERAEALLVDLVRQLNEDARVDVHQQLLARLMPAPPQRRRRRVRKKD